MTKETLKKVFAAAALALLVVPALSGCVESQVDIDRKPDLITQVMQQSMDQCDLQEGYAQTVPYAQRLEAVLRETDSAALDYIIENGITVCLDQRLPDTYKASFGETQPTGIYYHEQGVLSLYDNGQLDAGWLTRTATWSGDKLIEKLQAHNNEATTPVSIAGRFSCGKSCTTDKWKDGNDWWAGVADIITNNPQLATPPLKAAPARTQEFAAPAV